MGKEIKFLIENKNNLITSYLELNNAKELTKISIDS
jgi:hypothetical protein